MTVLIALAAMSLLITPASPQEYDPAEMQQRLDFLVGSWITTSTLPDTGEQLQGVLEYRWVLGKQWLKVEFYGKHPQREYWEAHGMMRWDAEQDEYISWVVFGPDPPVLYTGVPLEDGGVSMRTVRDGSTYGIDYHPRDIDEVYQENWVEGPDGKRRITLTTTYGRVSVPVKFLRDRAVS